jgi:hypothetical protein
VTVDHGRLRRAIADEVRRRREAGDVPVGFEQELHDTFDRLAPSAAMDADLRVLLGDVEEHSFFDTMAPIASAKPGGAVVKRTLRTALAFYIRHVTTQMDAFAHATGRMLRALAERLEAVERQMGAVAPAAALSDALASAGADLEAAWSMVIERALNHAPGPVLHVEGDDVADRLANMADGSLGAVVMGTDIELRPLGWKLHLVPLVARKAGEGAVIVVLSHAPDGRRAGDSAVAADLAPGRPLHAETWLWLLAREGFVDASVEQSDDPAGGYAVIVRRATGA